MRIGEKTNKLTLIKNTGLIKSGKRYYRTGLFQCECGNEKMILIKNIKSGNTKSCGCNYKISNKDKRRGHPLKSPQI